MPSDDLLLILSQPLPRAACGGVLIGLATWLLLASLGRVAGISGIVSGLFRPAVGEAFWRVAFVLGLVVSGALCAWVWPAPTLTARPVWLMLLAGALVGFGTVLGSGCTSGHGVCGLGRRSVRSLVAVLVFMGFGVATVWVGHWAPI